MNTHKEALLIYHLLTLYLITSPFSE